MESYIEDKKNLYTQILEFLEDSDEHNDDKVTKESFEKLINVIKSQQIETDKEEMRQFVEIIKSIGENHHRDHHFNKGINQLLLHYKQQIKQTLSNSEIYHMFEDNKKVVLFLLKQDIITISDEISKEMMNKQENNGNRYCHFFIPELEKFIGEEKMKSVKDELLNEHPNMKLHLQFLRRILF